MKLNLARLLIGLVMLVNLQCAVAFLLRPAAYGPSFELSGPPGAAMMRALGVLFLMWNVPYAVALWHPIRRRFSLFEALAMQAIGLAGETWIYLALPLSHGTARLSITRFIVFDACGLLALAAAAWLTSRQGNAMSMDHFS